MPDATSPEELIDIAVLDDDLDFRTYIEDFLNSEGLYAVRTFARSDEFFRGVEDKEPNIVLLDLKMGEVRGETVLGELLAKHPGMCVIVVTGYPSLENMRTTFKLKVFDYLAKPFSLAQLRSALNNATEAFGFGRSAQDVLRERLGHRIKLMRVERGWSLKDLAAAAKLSISLISSIERGANMPSVESLLAISKAFDKRPSEILAAIEF